MIFNQANKCEFGHNPKIDDICPNFREKNRNPVLKYIQNLTLSYMESIIIDITKIRLLQDKCKNGEWCLNNDILPKNPSLLQKHIFEHNTQLVCAFSSCIDEMKYYIDKCATSSISKNKLKIAPSICKLSTQSKNSSEFCAEQSLRLIYLSLASIINFKNPNARIVNVNRFFINFILIVFNCKPIFWIHL